MEKIDLNEYLASNEYPGRGIAVAMAPDGRQMFIGYFIMGRSENSRNRVFDPIPERGGIWCRMRWRRSARRCITAFPRRKRCRPCGNMSRRGCGRKSWKRAA